jgi:hypothetical protein
VVGEALDRFGDLVLWVLECTAETAPESDRVRSADRRLKPAAPDDDASAAHHGSVGCGSTYFAFRWTPEALRSARAILREASAFLNAEPEPEGSGADPTTPEA